MLLKHPDRVEGPAQGTRRRENFKGAITKYFRFAVVIGGIAATLAFAGAFSSAATPAAVGQLVVSFLYMPPSEIEPTYHTAMWLEDKNGHLVKTLFVSNELSHNDYKLGVACPDWVKQSGWAKAEKTLVDAVSGPTPNVGSSSLAFDLNKLGVAPGAYQFCFQVHITEKENVLFRGTFEAGQAAQQVKMDTFFSAGKPTKEELIKDVQVQYVPAAK